MSKEHRHKWIVSVDWATCAQPDCCEQLPVDEVERRLNAYAALEEQAERLLDAWYECPQDSVPDILDEVFIEIEMGIFLAGKKKAEES